MHLVLGIGGTDDSWTALERTVARVAETGDDLTVAILENPASMADPASIRESVERILRAADVTAEIVELAGDPAGALVAFAERNGFDRIVLGGGQRSPMGKITIGSIAEFVVLNAETSVTLIR